MPVVPTSVRDYPEWHHGRSDYSLWYIEIDQPELLSYLDQLRQHFAEFLLSPNIRQFHISLFICGFLTQYQTIWDDDFTHSQLKQHLQTLAMHQQLTFQLSTRKINSFETALFVEIQDQTGALQRLRHALQDSTQEIAALEYCPHITLGLYKEAVPSELIFEYMTKIEQQHFDFSINQLTFGYYDAQMLQGPLYPHTQLILGESCCN